MESIHVRFFSSLLFFAAVAFSLSAVAAPPEVDPLFAHLLGGNEVTNEGGANAGSPNGTGSATVLIKNKTTICYAILVNNIDNPIAAHIHKAVAGINGGVVIPLTPPDNGRAGTSSGCISNLDRTVVSDIARNPSGYYINVHSDKFKPGALRGQLF